VTIRKAQPTDITVLTQIAHDACETGGYPDDWIENCDLNVSEEDLEKKHAYVAEHGGEFLGFYVLTNDRSALEQMWVVPAHFGTGVGKELFLHAKEMIARKKSDSASP